MKIIQFLPYFTPHKGGLETHAQQWSKIFVQNNLGKVLIVTNDVGQSEYIDKLKFSSKESLIYDNNNNIIGYIQDGYTVLLLPSFEIISNFPFPKFWSKKYKYIKYLAKSFSADIVVSRTRFFVASLMAGIFAKINKIKRVHIEHGSGFVSLSSKFSTFCAYLWDKTIGKWIFKSADLIVPISIACQKFIKNEFIQQDMQVIYRGVEFPLIDQTKVLEFKNQFDGKIIIGFVGRLYKWKNVDNLIKAFYQIDLEKRKNLQLVIVGDGEDFEYVKSLDKENLIYFTGGLVFEDALMVQSSFDIHVHSSDKGGGLASTLLQAMWLGNFILATPYEGADEVIKDGFNGILLQDCKQIDLYNGLLQAIQYLDKKEEYSQINKQIIIQDFDWKNAIKKYNDLFTNILK